MNAVINNLRPMLREALFAGDEIRRRVAVEYEQPWLTGELGDETKVMVWILAYSRNPRRNQPVLAEIEYPIRYILDLELYSVHADQVAVDLSRFFTQAVEDKGVNPANLLQIQEERPYNHQFMRLILQ